MATTLAQVNMEMSVSGAETIISINLLERLGGGWHWQTPLRRIKGLTYIEETAPVVDRGGV